MRANAKIRVGIDLMGSDVSPDLLLRGIHAIAGSLPQEISLILIGTDDYAASCAPFSFVRASEAIGMTEPPLAAIRRKKGASLCVGMRMLKGGEIDALVSAGNTGALVSSAKITLGMLPGCSRPALLALMPTRKHPLAVLDVGANLESKAHHLVQLAFLGAAYQKTRGIDLPAVGLLNVGSEALKGTSEKQLAYKALSRLAEKTPFFRFAGNVEGKMVFDGTLDVLITDGFTGNVFLKTAEGIASLVLDSIQERLPPASLKVLAGHLRDFHSHLHYSEYPGALLSGVRGAVVKCHGHSSPEAFAQGALAAVRIAREGFFQTFQDKLFEIHQRASRFSW